MTYLYALMLADKATEVLGRIFKRDISSFQSYVDMVPLSGSSCCDLDLSQMSSGIELQVINPSSEENWGLLACGLYGESFIKTLAEYFCLSPDESEANSSELLAEFLNIVTGIASAAWLEKGFEVNFSPPLQNKFTEALPAKEKVYRIALSDRDKELLTIIFYLGKKTLNKMEGTIN